VTRGRANTQATQAANDKTSGRASGAKKANGATTSAQAIPEIIPDYARRVSETRARITSAGLDGLLVASQYNRRYLTGFLAHDGDITESSGWALVTRDTFALITSTFHLNGVESQIVPSGVTPLLADDRLPTDALAEGLKAAAAGQRAPAPAAPTGKGRAKSESAGAKTSGGAKLRLGFEQDWLSYASYARIEAALRAQTPDVELVPADDLVELVRASKDEAEIALIQRAADIANQAFARLVAGLRPGMTERQIAATLERHMVDLGADEPSFPTIVACGPGGALPHWVPSDREARVGEPLLIDFGCRVNGYCSDLTRTICLGEPDDKLRDIYGLVREAQDAGLAALKGGVRRGRDVDAAARKVFEDAGYGPQFMHSLGHGVGLAVHELPAISRLRINTPERDAELAKVEQIETNAVVTNEPGLYLAGWGGVRLEDMILARSDGATVFTDRNPEQIVSVAV